MGETRQKGISTRHVDTVLLLILHRRQFPLVPKTADQIRFWDNRPLLGGILTTKSFKIRFKDSLQAIIVIVYVNTLPRHYPSSSHAVWHRGQLSEVHPGLVGWLASLIWNPLLSSVQDLGPNHQPPSRLAMQLVQCEVNDVDDDHSQNGVAVKYLRCISCTGYDADMGRCVST